LIVGRENRQNNETGHGQKRRNELAERDVENGHQQQGVLWGAGGAQKHKSNKGKRQSFLSIKRFKEKVQEKVVIRQ